MSIEMIWMQGGEEVGVEQCKDAGMGLYWYKDGIN